jgi:hypothetical protein
LRVQSSTELGVAAEELARRQQQREAALREVVGPVVNRVKETAGAALAEHEGLSNLAAGLSQTTATRYLPPQRAARDLTAHEATPADAGGTAAEERAKIAAAEAAWQASGGHVMGLPAEGAR